MAHLLLKLEIAGLNTYEADLLTNHASHLLEHMSTMGDDALNFYAHDMNVYLAQAHNVAQALRDDEVLQQNALRSEIETNPDARYDQARWHVMGRSTGSRRRHEVAGRKLVLRAFAAVRSAEKNRYDELLKQLVAEVDQDRAAALRGGEDFHRERVGRVVHVGPRMAVLSWHGGQPHSRWMRREPRKSIAKSVMWSQRAQTAMEWSEAHGLSDVFDVLIVDHCPCGATACLSFDRSLATAQTYYECTCGELHFLQGMFDRTEGDESMTETVVRQARWRRCFRMNYPSGGSTRYLMRMPATPLCVNFEEKVPIDAVIKSDSFSDLDQTPTNGTSWDIEFDAASVVNDAVREREVFNFIVPELNFAGSFKVPQTIREQFKAAKKGVTVTWTAIVGCDQSVFRPATLPPDALYKLVGQAATEAALEKGPDERLSFQSTLIKFPSQRSVIVSFLIDPKNGRKSERSGGWCGAPKTSQRRPRARSRAAQPICRRRSRARKPRCLCRRIRSRRRSRDDAAAQEDRNPPGREAQGR